VKVNNQMAVFVSRRRWLKRKIMKWLPEMAFYPLFEDLNFYFDPRDIAGPSFHFAYDLMKGFINYEEKAKNELLALIPDDGIFFDIGANIGLYSIYFAKKKKEMKIYCFEPDSITFRCLRATLDSYKNNQNIFLYKKAVGLLNEKRKLYKSKINDGGHTLKEDYLKEYEKTKEHDYEIVSIVNLDNFLKQEQLPWPHAIKIDIEGHELQALKGLINTINCSRPTMLIESNNKDLLEKGPFWQFLSDLEKTGLYARQVGSESRLNLGELSKLAKENFNRGKIIENYFYQFKS